MAKTIDCGNCKAENPAGASFCWHCHSPKCAKQPSPTAAAAKIEKAAAKKRAAARKRTPKSHLRQK